MRRSRQQTFAFRKKPGKRGGRRDGAGRKRGKKVQHEQRARLDGRTPVHITLRVMSDLGRLRRRDQHRAIRRALALAAHRDDARICQYSIQHNHVHLIAEAATADALSRAMISFKTSCAKRLNRLAARSGKVFADRYHARYLASPLQVRRALAYCLNNWRRHAEKGPWLTDPFSSADFFDGWSVEAPKTRPPHLEETPPVSDAASWLLTTGWRRHRRIDPREVPGGR